MYNFQKLAVRKNRVYYAAKILLVIFFISLFASSLIAGEVILKNGKTIKGKIDSKTKYTVTVINEKGVRQNIRMTRVKKVIEDVVEPEKPVDTDQSGIVALLQPRLGMFLGMKFPLGSLSTPVSLGSGASIFSDIKIPLPISIINLRAGMDVGFYYFQATQLDTSLIWIPVGLRATLSFPLKMGLEPYLTIGGGLNYAVLGSDAVDPSESSADALVNIAVGVSYTHVKMKNFEVFFDLGYNAWMESTTGNFFQLNLGFAYRFGGTKKAEK